LYVFPRTRAWLASISDEAVDGEHLSAPLSDRSTPSPSQLSANSTPPPADEAAQDTHKTACLDATSVESNDAATCAPTTLENKSRQELQSDESYHVRSKGGRAPPSTPTLVEEVEQFASDDECDDDDDLSSWSSEVKKISLPHIWYLKRGMQPVISGEGTHVMNFLQGTPAHEEIDADFIYGPQLPEIDFALSDDEISEQVSYRTNVCLNTESNTAAEFCASRGTGSSSCASYLDSLHGTIFQQLAGCFSFCVPRAPLSLSAVFLGAHRLRGMIVQVGIAVRQLEKLRVQCSQTAVSALFVRWTIHNWNMQGPFNEEAYRHTLAMPLGTAAAAAHAAERCVETEEKQENAAATHANMTRGQATSIAVQAAVVIEGETMDEDAVHARSAHAGAAEETEAYVARRARGKGRWRPLDATPFDSPLGHVSGSGSVIIAASRPARVLRPTGGDVVCQVGQHSDECEGNQLRMKPTSEQTHTHTSDVARAEVVASDMSARKFAHEFADGVLAGGGGDESGDAMRDDAHAPLGGDSCSNHNKRSRGGDRGDRLPAPNPAKAASHDDAQRPCKKRASKSHKTLSSQDARDDVKITSCNMCSSSMSRVDSSSTVPPASPPADTLDALSAPATVPPSPEQHPAVATLPRLRVRTKT